MADRYEDRPDRSTDGQAAAVQPTSSKEGDPLAELARLIGQNDPFANFGRANPTHPLRNGGRPLVEGESADPEADPYFDNEIFDDPPSPPPWVQHRNEVMAARDAQDSDDISSRPHPLHRFAAQHQDADATDAQAYEGAHPEAYSNEPSAYGASSYPDDPYAYGDFAEQPDAADRRRRGLITVAAVVGLAVIGTGGAYAYRTFVAAPRGGDVPVIRADNSPIKVVPPTAGDAANKLIQDRLGTAGGETLVPREEKPVDVRDPSKAGARSPSPWPADRPNSSAAANVPSGGLPGEEPRRVRTVPVKGDPADVGGNAAAKPARPLSGSTASAPTPTPRAPAAPSPGQTAALSPQPLSLRPQATPASAPSGGYVVQVSSQRSEADAQASYRALQTKFPSVLGSRSPVIKRADLGDKGTYYRAVLGPFTSPEEAARLCGDLKSAGGQCVVQRN